MCFLRAFGVWRPSCHTLISGRILALTLLRMGRCALTTWMCMMGQHTNVWAAHQQGALKHKSVYIFLVCDTMRDLVASYESLAYTIYIDITWGWQENLRVDLGSVAVSKITPFCMRHWVGGFHRISFLHSWMWLDNSACYRELEVYPSSSAPAMCGIW